MRKAGILMATFVLAFAFGVIWSSFNGVAVEAKPTTCILAVTPFLVCEPSNRCKGAGEEFCYECQGWDPAGNPCLCRRIGCMVP